MLTDAPGEAMAERTDDMMRTKTMGAAPAKINRRSSLSRPVHIRKHPKIALRALPRRDGGPPNLGRFSYLSAPAASARPPCLRSEARNSCSDASFGLAAI